MEIKNSRYEKFSSMIKLVYEIKQKTIKIFRHDFVKKNRNNCKMIINIKYIY